MALEIKKIPWPWLNDNILQWKWLFLPRDESLYTKEGDRRKFYTPLSGRRRQAQHVLYCLGRWVSLPPQDLIRVTTYQKQERLQFWKQLITPQLHWKYILYPYNSAYGKDTKMHAGQQRIMPLQTMVRSLQKPFEDDTRLWFLMGPSK